MEFLNTIWIFFQDQILGMKWLNLLIGDVLSVAGVDIGGRLGGSIQFFLYDVVKITTVSYTHLDVYKRQGRRRSYQFSRRTV